MIYDCQFVKLDDRAKVPQRATERSIGMDLYLLEDVTIDSRELKIVPIGLIFIPPLGLHGEIVLRSSTPKKYPGLILANHIGIIDPDYTGPTDELKLALFNTRSGPMELRKDIPIAQIVLRENFYGTPQEISMEVYNSYAASKKNRGGFGSTDKGKGNLK